MDEKHTLAPKPEKEKRTLYCYQILSSQSVKDQSNKWRLIKVETKHLFYLRWFNLWQATISLAPHLMERFKGGCPHSLLLLFLLYFSLDECEPNSHISLLFFHSDSLSHELKEEPIDFPIA